MNARRLFNGVAALLVGIVLLMQTAPPALAQTPLNDDFDNATAINNFDLPFTDFAYVGESTAAGDDPTDCTNNGSVWYAYTPADDTLIEANTFGSNYDTVLSVYTGTRGDLTQVPGACNDDFSGGQSRVSFNATGGTTYYFLIGYCCGSGGNGNFFEELEFSVTAIVAAQNDDFTHAIEVDTLPFIHSVNTAQADLEPSEPVPPCIPSGWLSGSIWYAFTPEETVSVSARANGPFSTVVAAYTGGSLGSLTAVGCREFGGALTFQALAGTTYYVQTGSLFGETGTLQFTLDVTPPPNAFIDYYPFDPSVFDTIQFFDNSFDPGGMGIASQAWNFGDGAVAADCCPTHKYGADGDYNAELTVTTSDGRTASTVQQIQVRTHDVAITKFSAPQSGRAGQTRQISVGLNSKRYEENVRVELFKSVPGGYEHVGSLTQRVPVRGGNRTTDFSFSYTFTSEDAQLGKVTFKAVAHILDGRDALPADNESIASPTKVSEGQFQSPLAPGQNNASGESTEPASGIYLPRIGNGK